MALYDVGREGDTAYVVTELLEGVTLRERLTQGPLPARKALDYVRAIADAGRVLGRAVAAICPPSISTKLASASADESSM